MFRQFLTISGLILGLLLGLAACGDDDLERQIVGKWEISDPGGTLAGGHVLFDSTGQVTIVERIRTGGRISNQVFSGTYQFVDRGKVRMNLSRGKVRMQRQDVGVRLMDGRLTLMFKRGRVVYRRVG